MYFEYTKLMLRNIETKDLEIQVIKALTIGKNFFPLRSVPS